MMFQHIKLMPYKALREENLHDLGKINVICGQNSSGKSTLMEAIGNSETRRIGKKLLSTDIKSIFASSSRATAWREDAGVDALELLQPNSLGQRYSDMLQRSAQSKEVWNADLVIPFLQHMILEWQANSNFFGRYDLPEGEIKDAYNKLFVDDVSTVLVPPKRQIELDCTLSLSEPINNDGSGLLRYLFFAKNQAVGSEPQQTYIRIAEAFHHISGGHHFQPFPKQDNSLNLQFCFQNHPWRPAQDCGLGLQDLLVILYFATTPKYQAVMIEEPESHLHPQWQRKLLAFFRESGDKQFFLTTHSNIFLDAGLVDKVLFTTLNDSITVDDATGRAAILSELGYAVTDNLVSDLVILVEGPSDVAVIEQLLIKMGLYADFNVKIWPLGGDIMAKLDLTVFAEHYAIRALVDNDPKSGAIRDAFKEKCEELHIPLTRLQRYAIENYFPLRAIREVHRRFGMTIPESVTEIRPDETVESQIGFNVKRNNRAIAEAMILDDIQGTDLSEFLENVRMALQGTA